MSESSHVGVLAPLDTSAKDTRVMQVAADLARVRGEPLVLATVVSDPDVVEQAREILSSEAGRMNIEPDAILIEVAADVVEGIARHAAAIRLICMATAASLLPHGGHIGSIAEGVVRTAGRPVALVGPHASEARVARVVLPVDGSARSEAAADLAGSLAAAYGVPLWVVTVLAPSDEAAAARAHGPDAVLYESGYVRRLARSIATRHDVDGEFEVLHGPSAGSAIVDFAAHDGLVVMSTHGRTGLARLLSGSVARDVVADAPLPVVLLRPEESSLVSDESG